jgi:hypothetical protein
VKSGLTRKVGVKQKRVHHMIQGLSRWQFLAQKCDTFIQNVKKPLYRVAFSKNENHTIVRNDKAKKSMEANF